MNLKEIYIDQVGWVVSKGGNKSRAKKSFYMQNKAQYMSPWFTREIDCTNWINKNVYHRGPKSTMTLYEVYEDAIDAIQISNEQRVQKMVANADKTKKIKRSELEYLKKLASTLNRKPEVIDKLIQQYHIQIIDDVVKEQVIHQDTKCPKCGGQRLTTGIEKNDKDGNKLTSLNNAVWFHQCLDCKTKIPVDNTKQENNGEALGLGIQMESDTGGMAGYNGPLGGSVSVTVDKKGNRKRKKSRGLFHV